MSPADVERTKLLANALDRASTACFTVGVATPAAGILHNIGGMRESTSWLNLTLGLANFRFAAASLNLLARRILRRLE